MRDTDRLRQSVRGMEFDLDQFEKMLDAQRAVLTELVNSVESLQRQVDSLKTQVSLALRRSSGNPRNRV